MKKALTICFALIVCFLFVAADYQDVTESFGSLVTGLDTLLVLSGQKDTSRVYVQDKYNNKVLTMVLDDPQNTSGHSGDQYKFKVYILQAVAVYNNNSRLYLTPSHCVDSVVSDSLEPANVDTTHFTSQGLFYYSLQMDYTHGFAVVLEGLTGTRASGNKPRAYLRVDQRKRL